MRRSDVPQLVLDARHAGELLATPCACGRQGCILGEHIWSSTQDMKSGPRAANTDPGGGNRWDEPDETGEVWPAPPDRVGDAAIEPDPTDGKHLEYVRALLDLQQATRTVVRLVHALRPDRRIPLPESATIEMWCRPCLDIGVCTPRYRGDTCRWDYDFKLAYGVDAPPDLRRVRHEGRRITDQMITDALQSSRPVNGKKKRRRAKTG